MQLHEQEEILSMWGPDAPVVPPSQALRHFLIAVGTFTTLLGNNMVVNRCSNRVNQCQVNREPRTTLLLTKAAARPMTWNIRFGRPKCAMKGE